MKQKNYSNSSFSSNGHSKTTWLSRYMVKGSAIVMRKPKKAIIGMVAFATFNFALMVFLVNRKPAPSLLPKNSKQQTETVNQQGVDFSISNYMKIKKLKDSLDYLIKKGTLTKEDSLLFLRIAGEYSRLDPQFGEAVNKALHKK